MKLVKFLSRNDQTSVQMLLGMRQEEMDKADMFTKNINCLISVLPPEEAAKVDNLVKGQENWNPNEQISEKIMEKRKEYPAYTETYY